VKHGLVTLVVINDLEGPSNFWCTIYIFFLFWSWNITAVEINSGVHLLRSYIREVPLFTSGGLGLGLVSSGLGLGLTNLVLFTSLLYQSTKLYLLVVCPRNPTCLGRSLSAPSITSCDFWEVRAAQLHVIFNILLGIRVVGSALTQGVVALASLHCQLTSTVITLLQLFGTSVARVRPALLIFKANSFVINHRLLSESSAVSIYVAIGRTLGRPHILATFKLTPRNGDFGCWGGLSPH